MATTTIVSAEVAVESSYCSLDAGTRVPSTGGLTFYAAEISDRSQINTIGDATMTPQDAVARDGLYEIPPEVISVIDDGAAIERRTGTFSLTMPVRGRGDGTAYDSWAKLPLWNLVLTALEAFDNDTVGLDILAGAASATSFTAADATKYEIGNMVKFFINSCQEFAGVTDIDGTTITVSPALSATPTGKTAYPMIEAVVPDKGVPTTQSVCVKMNGVNYNAIAYGCEATGITFNLDPVTKALSVTVDLYSPFISIAATSDSTVPVLYADGGILHHVNAYMVVSTTGWDKRNYPTAPAALARATVCLDEFSLAITIERSNKGCGESVVGQSGTAITNIMIAGQAVAGDVTTTYDADFFTEKMRSVLIGFSSGDFTSPTAGEGGCIYIPSAVFKTEQKKLNSGKPHYRTEFNFGAGRWQGDDSTADPANSVLRFALGDVY